MKNSPDISQLGTVVGHFFRRYHVVLFVLTVVVGVSAAIFLLNGLVTASNTMQENISPETTASFDKKTIERISGFGTPGAASQPFNLPPGRANLFAE